MGESDQGGSLTLGIASVRQLLIEEELTRSSASEPAPLSNLQIPMYQRPYKWTEKNALRLLDDILEARNESRSVYRVGTLILHRHDESDSDSSGGRGGSSSGYDRVVLDVVDGQQRAITFTLLIKALGGSCGFLKRPLPDSQITRRNAFRNYKVLEQRAEDIGKNLCEELLEYVEDHCEFVVVITENLSEAFQFFDSQNARGKSLYPHDLLKAYHLREMGHLSASETEAIVETWEGLDQEELASFFADYLYCLKQWVRGNRAGAFTEKEIPLFKGVNASNTYPYAQFYKGAYAYADTMNSSTFPFVTGMGNLRKFQLHTPIIAGKPFFEYAAYYYAILEDIRDNSKYEGYFINDNPIVKTLEKHFNERTGDKIARLMFDTAVLLYVDRFCPDRPELLDLQLFDRFVKLAFVWAYSLRAQYQNLGWPSAQNYILGESNLRNAFNIYKEIIGADDANELIGALSEMMQEIRYKEVKDMRSKPELDTLDKEDQDAASICKHYLCHFGRYLKGAGKDE